MDILPPTEKLEPLLIIEAEDTVPLFTSLIVATVLTPVSYTHLTLPTTPYV